MILHANSIYCDVFVQFDNVFHSRKGINPSRTGVVCFLEGVILVKEGNHKDYQMEMRHVYR